MKDYPSFDCDICGCRYLTKHILCRHMRWNHLPRKETFFCSQCDYRTHENYKMKFHIKVKHDKILDHKCPKCNKGYGSLGLLNYHLKLKHSSVKLATKPAIECPECKRMFSNIYNFRDHMGTKHPTSEPEFLCHVCTRRFHTEKSLSGHSKTHEEVTCEQDGCGLKFPSKKRFLYHFRRDHEMFRYQCDMCTAVFRNQSFVKRHKEAVHLGYRYYCVYPGCKLEYKHQQDVKVHIRKHHTQDPDELQKYKKLVFDQKPHIFKQ